jgi:hypothetical protein
MVRFYVPTTYGIALTRNHNFRYFSALVPDRSRHETCDGRRPGNSSIRCHLGRDNLFSARESEWLSLTGVCTLQLPHHGGALQPIPWRVTEAQIGHSLELAKYLVVTFP